VYLWGPNSYCETADNATVGSYDITPYSEPTLSTVVSLSMGTSCSAAILANGTLYLWGANAWGQLGLGHIDYNPHCTPNAVALGSAGTPVLKVSLGDQHVCAIAQGGILYCWGDNSYGRAGIGSLSGSSSPVLISAIVGVLDISADLYNTYALDSANVT